MKKGDDLKTRILWCSVTGTGALMLLYSIWLVAHLDPSQFPKYAVFIALTALIAAFPARFPNSKTKVSVSEAVIFASVPLFGPGPAAILATIDGYLGSRKSVNGQKVSTSAIIHCTAMLTISIFVSALCFNFVIGAQRIDVGIS